MLSFDPRQAPDAAFIAQIRRRFPVEAELDRILTRKMQRRCGPAYAPIPLQRLIDGAIALIRKDIGDTFTLADARWLTGGASKIQMAFSLEWRGLEGGNLRRTRMVLRMEPPESVVETSRLREVDVLKALAGVVPVPQCYWLDADGTDLPYPALIYEFVDGVVRPTHLPSTQVTGIGLNYGPALRPKLARNFLEQMGRFHNPGAAFFEKLGSFDKAEAGSNHCVIRQLHRWRRIWEEDRQEDDPLMEATYQWLIRNAPAPELISLVHGDARGGNFLFDEDEARITAWLDWELAVPGDRHQDLAYSMMNCYRHTAEDGKTELVNGFLPFDDYLETYERLSGLAVDRRRLNYYRVLCSYVSVTICSASAYRVARGGKTHQDVVVAWLAMITPLIESQLRTTLEEII